MKTKTKKTGRRPCVQTPGHRKTSTPEPVLCSIPGVSVRLRKNTYGDNSEIANVRDIHYTASSVSFPASRTIVLSTWIREPQDRPPLLHRTPLPRKVRGTKAAILPAVGLTVRLLFRPDSYLSTPLLLPPPE
jgi:hypothetical protein